jgi:hypothetical protein
MQQESLIPKFKRHGGISKKSKPDFNNVTMLSFGCTVLLVSMGTGNAMSNTNLLKEGI